MALVVVSIQDFGVYSAPSDVVDMMIARHLPTSPEKLRVIVEEQAGHSCKGVTDVSSLLIMLADFENARVNP
jgi:hypothetical protein